MAKLRIDEALVRQLSDLLAETGLSEIEYEAEGHRLRVCRNTAVATTPPATPVPVPIDASSSDAIPENAITAPMVGTVYMSPEPEAEAFVKVGDSVKEGQTLLIIEAMKVMNQIPSPRAGQVTTILVRDGQPVEFGEPLLVVG